MAKLSLLEIVQDILNDADSDPVNSINDTVEGGQVAQIVKTCYFEMIASRNWPHLRKTVQLDASLDPFQPTHLKLPVGVKELLVFNYNKLKPENAKDRFGSLKYYQPEEFLRKINSRNSLEDNILKVTDFGGIALLMRNDKQPEFYTSFDDEYVVTDSWDTEIENTLTTANTQCVVYQDPSWTTDDSFIPDLPSEAFPALLEEAKSTAFIVLKQQANEKAEQKSKRQQRWLSRKSWRVSGGVQYPNYGRAGRVGHSQARSTLIDKDGVVNVS
jgi:hypothetical protein